MGSLLDDAKNVGGKAAETYFGGGVGGALANSGGTTGKVFSGDFSGAASDVANIGSGKKAAEAAAAQQQSIQEQQGKEQGVLDTEKQQGQKYYGGVADAAGKYQKASGTNAEAYTGAINKNTNAYTSGLGSSMDQYIGSGRANTNQYVEDQQRLQSRFEPQYGQLSSNAMGNANSAMTLQQAMSPNNSVEQGIQGMYDQQAQGIQKQGLADYGVMNAMGAEATGNQLGSGGMPITGSQMQALLGSNTAQAGSAFANAQNQANQLRMQGLGAGINQSNLMYGEGQQAQQTAQGAIGNQAAFNQGIGQNIYGAQTANAQNVYGAQQSGLANTFNAKQSLASDKFGVNQGLAATNYNTDAGLAGLNYQMQQQDDQNQMGMINQVYGAQQQADIAKAQAANAVQAGQLGAIGSVAGTVGGFFAGAMGGGGIGGGGGGGGGGGMMGSMAQGAQLGQQQAGLVNQSSGNQAYMQPVQQWNAPNQGYQPGSSFPGGSPYGQPAYGQPQRVA